MNNKMFGVMVAIFLIVTSFNFVQGLEEDSADCSEEDCWYGEEDGALVYSEGPETTTFLPSWYSSFEVGYGKGTIVAQNSVEFILPDGGSIHCQGMCSFSEGQPFV